MNDNFLTTYFKKVTDLGRWRFGLQHDLVGVDGKPYLERWFLWLGITFRVHKFYRGDQDRALHDHPWWFITFPFAEYYEVLDYNYHNPVKAWRFHFRPTTYRHRVIKTSSKPFYTFVITGWKTNEWGFWPNADIGGDTFVHHTEWEGDEA